MGQSLVIVVVHNCDFDPRADVLASQADVENAARDVARALTDRGHRAETLAVAAARPGALDGVAAAAHELRRRAPDLVFNLCESLGGDGRHEPVLPSLLELAGVPYTRSGPLGARVAPRQDLDQPGPLA